MGLRTLYLHLLLVGAFARLAEAGCGSASCPIDIYNQHRSEKGSVRLDYSYEYIDQDQPRIGRRRASVGEIRGHHDELYTLNQIKRLGMEVGLTSRFSLQLGLPFVHRDHQHVHHHRGEDIIESWDINGMGDLSVLGRYAIIKPENPRRPVISFLAGGKLPTARAPIVNAEGDEAEAGILPGAHARSLILGASSLQTFSARALSGLYAAMPLFFSSTYEWNDKGQHNYRLGNTWLANAGVVYPVLPKIGLMTQINARISRRDDRGSTREEIQKTGGSFIYISPGLQLSLAENLVAFALVQLPVYQRVNVIQLTSSYNIMSGVSYRFNVLK